MTKVYATIDLRSGWQLWVTVQEYRGRHYVHVRRYWIPPGGEAYKETRKGIAILPEHVAEVRRALAAAEADARRLDKEEDEKQ